MTDRPDDVGDDAEHDAGDDREPPRPWRPSPLVLAVLVVVGLALVALVAMRSGEPFTPAPGVTGTDAAGPAGTTTTAWSGPTTSAPAAWQTEYLSCVAERESGDDPTAVGPGGVAFGEYQITQQSWDNTAEHYGWDDLVGVDPAEASVADQQQVAMGLLQWQGTSPWSGDCVSG